MIHQVQPTCDTDEMEADVTAVIEACGGDPRAAIKALLIEQLVQEQRIERLAAALSFGYVRGRIDGMACQSGPAIGRSPDRPSRWIGLVVSSALPACAHADLQGPASMRHNHSRKSQRLMTQEIADKLLEPLRPTRHLLTRTLAHIPINGPEYRQINRVVQEIDELAKILIGDGTHYHQKVHSVPSSDTGRGGEQA